MEPITIQQATHTGREIILPNGTTLTIQRLRLRDYTVALTVYGHMLSPMAIRYQREPSQEEVKLNMPVVMAEMLNEQIPVSVEVLVTFLRFFCPDITADTLFAFDMADMETLWMAMWEDNRIPFEQTRLEMIASGKFAAAIEEWDAQRPLVTSSDFSAFLSGLDFPSENSATSPLTSPSPSPKSKKTSRSGKRRKSATGAASATDSPTPAT